MSLKTARAINRTKSFLILQGSKIKIVKDVSKNKEDKIGVLNFK